MTAARSLRRYVERASRPVLLQPATPPPGTRPYEGDIQMIDSSSIRVHQHAANAQKKMIDPVA